MFYIIMAIVWVWAVFGSDIHMYFYNRKSDEEKYYLWRKWRADYNHKNGIIDECQYDYLHGSSDDDH